ncbi:MAG: SDR family oxidoreductase [Hyphomonas sp.]|nr:SDR family oxidoreductase [Hyphomonas sp.]
MTLHIQAPFSDALKDRHVVVVGGGSGMGKQAAMLAAAYGARVTIASRNEQKLRAAAEEIGEDTSVAPVDMTDEAAVKAWAKALGPVDHLVITASSAAHGPFAEVPTDTIRAMFEAKFFGPYVVARSVLPQLTEGGSITLFSGVLSRRPGANATGLGAVNSAVEGLVRGLALELGARARVNAVSPGMVDTEAYEAMDAESRKAMFESVAGSLPLGRVGNPDEIAQAVLMVMANAFLTGTVLDIDGGHMVRG